MDVFQSDWLIRIGGYVFECLVNQTFLSELNRLGDCDPNGQQIRLNVNTLPLENKLETLIHEILEAIKILYRVNIKNHEDICRLSVGLTSFFMENPVLIKELVQMIENYNQKFEKKDV